MFWISILSYAFQNQLYSVQCTVYNTVVNFSSKSIPLIYKSSSFLCSVFCQQSLHSVFIKKLFLLCFSKCLLLLDFVPSLQSFKIGVIFPLRHEPFLILVDKSSYYRPSRIWYTKPEPFKPAIILPKFDCSALHVPKIIWISYSLSRSERMQRFMSGF